MPINQCPATVYTCQILCDRQRLSALTYVAKANEGTRKNKGKDCRSKIEHAVAKFDCPLVSVFAENESK